MKWELLLVDSAVLAQPLAAEPDQADAVAEAFFLM